MILGGGLLIAIPGFITDVAGLFAAAPFTRPAVRSILTRWMSRRAALGGLQMTPPWPRRSGDGGQEDPAARDSQVIQGEVLKEHTGERGGEADDGRSGRTDGGITRRADGR